MQNLQFDTPCVRFSDLDLHYDPIGNTLVCHGEPLRLFLAENNLPLRPERMKTSALAEVLLAWYLHSRTSGRGCTAREQKAVAMLLDRELRRPLVLLWRAPRRRRAKMKAYPPNAAAV